MEGNLCSSSSQDNKFVSTKHCRTYSNDVKNIDIDEELSTDGRSRYERGRSRSNVVKSCQVSDFQKKLRHANDQFFGLFMDPSIKRLFIVLVGFLLFVTIAMIPSNKARFYYIVLILIFAVIKEVLGGFTTKLIVSLNDATFEHDLSIIRVLETMRFALDPIFFLLCFHICGPQCPVSNLF